MNCAIIGAGQLGSRHLQGLLNFNHDKLNIYIIDPSKEALQIAHLRAQELSHQHQIHYCKAILDLPSVLEFVVIATNSKVRLAVLKSLVAVAKVKYLILEKVLFPSVGEHEEALEIVENNGIKCWVNHPRRMFNDYQVLKKYFSKEKTYSFQLLGTSWGLACNALHFIDLFEFLTDSALSSLSTQFINTTTIESKRSGYIEFEGTLQGSLDNKHLFSISSLSGPALISPTLSVMTDDLRILIQESGQAKIYLLAQQTNFALEELPFSIQFQSQLTGVLFEQISQTGNCDLPTLNHSARAHKMFISSFLQHWNNAKHQEETHLPIT